MSLFQNARILLYLSPYMDKIGKEIQMSKNVHSIIQILLTAVQALNGFTSFVPPKFQIWVSIGISGIQGIIGVLNHFDPSATTTPTSSTT